MRPKFQRFKDILGKTDRRLQQVSRLNRRSSVLSVCREYFAFVAAFILAFMNFCHTQLLSPVGRYQFHGLREKIAKVEYAACEESKGFSE